MNRVKAWLVCLTILFLIGCGGKPESDSNETGSSKTGSNATQSSSPPEVDIATAISEGNVQAVEQHLAAGTDPNHKDPTSGSPILNAAAVYGHREIVEALLKEGAKVARPLEALERKLIAMKNFHKALCSHTLRQAP